MGKHTYITPREPGAMPWRAANPRDRIIGALTRHGACTREELVQHTGDPRDEIDALINALLIAGRIAPVLDKYRAKTPQEIYERQVTLHDGRVVGSWSGEYLREGEARSVLRMPTKMHRAGYILRVRNRRGDEAANDLEALVINIYRAEKAAGVYDD